MTPEEAQTIRRMVKIYNCCDVEAGQMSDYLAEEFPEYPWMAWYEEDFG